MLPLSNPLILTNLATVAEDLMAFKVTIPVCAVAGTSCTTLREGFTAADLRRLIVGFCCGFQHSPRCSDFRIHI